MIIYYLAAIYPQKYQNILDAGKMVSPAYKFNKLLAEGFSTIPNVEVRCIVPKVFLDALPDAICCRRETENGLIYIYVDRKKGKNSYFSFIKSVVNEIKAARQSERVLLVCDAVSLNFSLLCLWMKWIYRITNVAIITDFPNYIVSAVSTKLKGKALGELGVWLMRKYDKYVLLTKEMGTYINKRKKPECIMEGVCDSRAIFDDHIEQITGKKVCLYAGALHHEYGIEMLIEAFLQINVSDCELHLYGDGNYRQQIEQICAANENVYYYGVKPNEYIMKEERKATLLINPRPSSDEYTKYSFPSKTLEYMASGTPLLMTKLPGLPQSYYPYVYLFEEETVDGFRVGLEKVLNKAEDELLQMGKRARRFILENKCPNKQARKIFEELRLGES